MAGAGLLAILRKRHGFVSGEELSEILGVSRTAVWKQVHQLEDAGYLIKAVPHRGYQFVEAPDRLLPDEIRWWLKAERMGREIYCYQETTSTNDRAMALAQDGLPEGTVVAAEYQSKGRGRRERIWVSHAGKNLLFSMIFRPAWAPEQAGIMTLLASVAVARSIQALCGLDVKIKWPNDVVYGGKKIAGILTEMQAQADQIRFLVVGIGVNVNHLPEGEMRTPATALSVETGAPVARIPLMARILDEIEKLYDHARQSGRQVVLEQWNGFSSLTGTQVRIAQADGTEVVGTVMGLNENGAINLRMEMGKTRTVASGEIVGVEKQKVDKEKKHADYH